MLNLLNYGRTLAIGAAGGFSFSLVNAPLAWMLGSLIFTAAAATKLDLVINRTVQNGMTVVLGVLVGSAMHPGLLDNIVTWKWSIISLLAYLAIGAATGFVFLRAFTRLDAVTSYFAAAPGGLTEMLLTAAPLGGRTTPIALLHTIRVIFVAVAVPFGVLFWKGTNGGGVLSGVGAGISLTDVALFCVCALGVPIAYWLRLPTYWLVGPMLISGAFHVTGVTAANPPFWIIVAAQVVIGASLGLRFRLVEIAGIGKVAIAGLILTATLLTLSLLFAFTLHTLTGLPFADLLLAFCPAGFTEMSIVALGLHANVAFVSVHHIVRLFAITLTAPVLFRLFHHLMQK